VVKITTGEIISILVLHFPGYCSLSMEDREGMYWDFLKFLLSLDNREEEDA